jgi:uncharacterized surface protein with fasciclin (FAS1) repeats
MNKQSIFLNFKIVLGSFLLGSFLVACNEKANPQPESQPPANGEESNKVGSQAAVVDNESQMNVVKVAIGSKDHTTLVKAVQAADLVDVLANSGPYTVFAPTNAAFDLLPKGTVEGLLAPDKKKDLANILQYHVAVPVLKENMLKDGQKLGMANGDNATIAVKDGKIMINDANVVGTVMASNGIVYVIDKVLLPPAKN